MSTPPAADRHRYTTLAHGDLEILNPLPRGALERVLDAFSLGPDPEVLDLGCGKGALLLDAVTHLGGRGRGIDRNAAFIAAGEAMAAARGLADRVVLEVGEVREDALAFGAWDLVLCVGARPLGQTLEENLGALARLLRPGGAVVLGEGYWRRPPAPEYLAVLGAAVTEMPERSALDRVGEGAGLRVQCIVEASEDAWESYEGAYLSNMLGFVAAHPSDPDAARFEARARGWNAAYQRWGRDTLGFALVGLTK